MNSLKKTLLICALSMASTAFALQPNNCNDGAVYRSMTGPDVRIDSKANKTLTVGGKVLIECRTGNTTTCVGTTYNNYTCKLNFSVLKGVEALTVKTNLHLSEGEMLTLTQKNSAATCGYMHCIEQDTLYCTAVACGISPIVSGWNE